jgi:hypothetical protein
MDAENPPEPTDEAEPEAVGVAHVPNLRSILEENTATNLPVVQPAEKSGSPAAGIITGGLVVMLVLTVAGAIMFQAGQHPRPAGTALSGPGTTVPLPLPRDSATPPAPTGPGTPTDPVTPSTPTAQATAGTPDSPSTPAGKPAQTKAAQAKPAAGSVAAAPVPAPAPADSTHPATTAPASTTPAQPTTTQPAPTTGSTSPGLIGTVVNVVGGLLSVLG